jgi:predicted acetyltransferase
MHRPPEVSVRPATEDDRPVVVALAQLYMHDLSAVEDWELDETGRFGVRCLTGCWPEPGEVTDVARHPFLIRADDRIAGFAVVDGVSRVTGDRTVTDMAEFFVVRRWRRHGVGRTAAHQLVAAFPGRWEIRPFPGYPPAAAFWRRVSAELAGDGVRTGTFQRSGRPAPMLAFSMRPGHRRSEVAADLAHPVGDHPVR